MSEAVEGGGGGGGERDVELLNVDLAGFSGWPKILRASPMPSDSQALRPQAQLRPDAPGNSAILILYRCGGVQLTNNVPASESGRPPP